MKIRIGDKAYAVRRLQAGDLAALQPLLSVGPGLIRQAAGTSTAGPVDLPGLVVAAMALADPLVDALAQLLDCPRARIARLELHELLGVVEQFVPAWMALNAQYLDAQVTPAMTRLSVLLSEVAGRIATPATPPEPPRQ